MFDIPSIRKRRFLFGMARIISEARREGQDIQRFCFYEKSQSLLQLLPKVKLMKIIVDTSVVIAVIANEPEKPLLIAKTQGAELIAPASLHWEIGNAFSAMLKRQRITAAQALTAVGIYQQIAITLLDVSLLQALELADRLKIYAYDAYVIACALNQNCSLLTLDSGLIYAAKAAGVQVLEVN